MDMNKIAMLSQFLGADMDTGNMMEMAKKVKALTTMMGNTENKPVVAQADGILKDTMEDSPRSRQINAINMAIPFLDVDYQKGLFMVAKLMEIHSFQPEGTIMAMEKGSVDRDKRRLEMLDAVDSCLSIDERKTLGVFLKLAKAGTFLK